MSKEVTSREDDYSQWYNNLVIKSGLAEYSAVRGCMNIKPYGFGLWENMRDVLDRMFKDTGHENAYFPVFVPKSLFEAEEENAEGFAKECAVVTHYRLKNDPENPKKLIVDPEAKLEEELVVRPTSEAIIWNSYKNWIQSYRDLPILINQWANVVRWEMRTRLFLRTTEFLWQEGHTAHATEEEAWQETKQMLDIYADFAENYLAIPVVKGIKTANERFAGAVETLCIEAMMQDGKALQAGTSHFLGQNFAKAFDVKFSNTENEQEYVWASSWGVSTRLIGAIVMSHGDDDGLILPPRVAPLQVVIVPICKPEQQSQIDEVVDPFYKKLKKAGIRVKYDDDDKSRPGWKFAEYELKGVPLRVVFGLRDLEKSVVEIARRDTKEKFALPIEDLTVEKIKSLLDEIHQNMYDRRQAYNEQTSSHPTTWEEFKTAIDKGGYVYAHWDGSTETEKRIKEETGATIRCIPMEAEESDGKCILTDQPSDRKVIFAKAY